MMHQDVLQGAIASTVSGFVAQQPTSNPNPNPISNPALKRKRRSLPGTPDPNAEVIAMSPKSLMTTNRFLCEICNKGFQRDQNLQLHRRGHNLPWKLKQRTSNDIHKKVYICPEKTCVHHEPSRALGDLTGIKKHFSRKHGEKKWKCEKCSKRYAVQSDWKAHAKICGTKEYRCDCGSLFSRKDSFITHRAFCDVLAQQSARFTNPNFRNNLISAAAVFRPQFAGGEEQKTTIQLPMWLDQTNNSYFSPEMVQSAPTSMFAGATSSPMQWQLSNKFPEEATCFTAGSENATSRGLMKQETEEDLSETTATCLYPNSHVNHQQAHVSATALLQRAAQMGSTTSCDDSSPPLIGIIGGSYGLMSSANGFDFMVRQQRSEADELNDLMNSISSASDHDHGFSSASVMMNLDRPVGTAKNKEVDEHGLTRDFLGVVP